MPNEEDVEHKGEEGDWEEEDCQENVKDSSFGGLGERAVMEESVVGLIVPSRQVKSVKTALEVARRFGKKIERWKGDNRDSKDGDGGDLFLVYTNLRWERASSGDGGGADGGVSGEANDDITLLRRLGISEALQHHVRVIGIPVPATSTSPPSTSSPAPSSLQIAVSDFLRAYPPPPATQSLSLPKRWTYYPPLLLLPFNTPLNTPTWKTYLEDHLTTEQQTSFYQRILESISHPIPATHIAINAPIPLENSDGAGQDDNSPTTAASTCENILRKPLHIHPLYGDDFHNLWCTTVQNRIKQTWQPLHTMFSRGNIREKTRILTPPPPLSSLSSLASAPSNSSPTPSLPGYHKIPNHTILDLYAGIGYFTLSYLRASQPHPTMPPTSLLLTWELNPASIDGLIRGSLLNNFGTPLVIQNDQPVTSSHLLQILSGKVHIVIFAESNEFALDRIREMRRLGGGWEKIVGRGRISHVNLGLLPSSRGAWGVTGGVFAEEEGRGGEDGEGEEEEGWIHVHENVAVGEVEEKKGEVLREFMKIVESGRRKGRMLQVECVNVFVVKTYAPGILHCVFDLHVFQSPERE